ncbi:MAG: FkbM family methyltransferase [Candidatus Lokiarchaeota archaeon]|nr:FkbM family methyltransferase [Candidatus Lokiarchaeota archaeon]
MIALNKLNKLFVLFSKLIPNRLWVIILRGPLRGYRWLVGAAAGEAKGLSILFNLSEKSQMKKARENLSKNGICFDIGANVGIYTLLFSRYSKKVYSFEPLPRNISYLFRIISKNNIKNAIIVPCAVSNTNEILKFKEGDSIALGKLDKKGTIPVQSITLDNFVKNLSIKPNMLKIDVEGAELAVLQGADELLRKSKPKILLSTHGNDIKQKCLNYLNDIGYEKIEPIDIGSIKKATEFLIK